MTSTEVFTDAQISQIARDNADLRKNNHALVSEVETMKNEFREMKELVSQLSQERDSDSGRAYPVKVSTERGHGGPRIRDVWDLCKVCMGLRGVRLVSLEMTARGIIEPHIFAVQNGNPNRWFRPAEDNPEARRYLYVAPGTGSRGFGTVCVYPDRIPEFANWLSRHGQGHRATKETREWSVPLPERPVIVPAPRKSIES